MALKSDDRGIFVVFKLFLIIRLLFSFSSQLFQNIIPSPGPGGGPPPTVNLSLSMLSFLEISILFAYLSIKWLENKLGRWYLPIALAFACIMPIIEDYFQLRYFQQMMNQTNFPDPMWMDMPLHQAALAGQYQLGVLLLLPFTFVCWEYRFRWAIVYCMSFVILGLLLIPPLLSNGFAQFDVVSVILTRMVLYLVFGYIIHRLVMEQRSNNLQLEITNQQLARFAGTLEQLTISRERNRLAHELHDTVAHTLSGLAVQLEAVKSLWDVSPSEAYTMLERSLKGTRAGLTETRRALQALRATPLEDLGLALAVQNIAETAGKRAGFITEIQIPSEIESIQPQNEQAIYRVLQEALENIVRHADAKTVKISLSNVNGIITLIVSDDGVGFDIEEKMVSGHYGLRGMKERSEIVGGQLEILSKIGTGTTVRLFLKDNPIPMIDTKGR